MAKINYITKVNNIEADETGNVNVSGGGTLTAEQIKALYESNANTNAFTNNEKTKLAGLENFDPTPINEQLAQIQIGNNLGFIIPSTPAPPTTGIYRGQASEPGTYVNFGGAVVTAEDFENNFIFIEVKNGVANLVLIKKVDGLSAYEIAVKNGFVGTESEWLESLKQNEDEFPLLSDINWDGSNNTLKILNSDVFLNLVTQKKSGNLLVIKGFYNKKNLYVNGSLVPIFGNSLVSFIRDGDDFHFTVKKKVSSFTSLVGSGAEGVKFFTGNETEVITSSSAGLLTSNAFSMGVTARISSNGFIAIGRGTVSERFWDFIFTNYNQPNNRVEAGFNVGSVFASTVGLNKDLFYKFIVTYNGYNRITLFINGNQVSSVLTSAITTGGAFNVGKVVNLVSRSSSIKHLFMINKQLSPAEVIEMGSKLSPNDASFAGNVIEYWDFGGNSSIPVSTPKELVFSADERQVLRRSNLSFESGDIANPDIIEDTIGASGFRYLMNYSAYGTIPSDPSPKWRMCLAYSNDLLNWQKERENPVFSPSPAEGYISSNGTIICFNNKYYHFYQRGNSGDIASSQICLATSIDLKNWTRENFGNPVILPTAGFVDSLACYDPFVKFVDGKLKMLYTGYSDRSYIVYAESTNGITWTNKKAIITQVGGVSEPCFEKIGNRYFITCDYYTGSPSGNSREIYGAWWDGSSVVTVSKVLSNNSASWMSQSVFDSTLLFNDGKLYMYYAGGNNATINEGLNADIGIAVAEL